MTNDFTNKNIIVTGGSSGIGLALVTQFLKLGANVWIFARDENKIKSVIEKLSPQNNQINYYAVDVQDYSKLKSIASQFNTQSINIDGIINSAGVAHPEEFEKMDIEQFHWLMDINYFGTVNCIKAFLPLLKTGSFIVNISSMAGIIGVYGYAGYGASKYAVRGFTDVIRSELKPKNIHVSIVYPPDTDTPQLVGENKIKPEITRKIAGTAKVMSAAQVAREIIKGIQKRKYQIIPGLESKVIYHLSNFLGPLVFPLMDTMVSQAIKEMSKKNK